MSTAKVTVLMPVYNAGLFLKESIESILNQTFSDFLFLIVNDGSTDNSEEVILGFKDSRIIYYKKEKNSGIVDTLNIGLSMIITPYIARMDADDISLPDRLELQFNFLEKNPNFGVCGAFVETFGIERNLWKYPENSNEIKPCIFFRNLCAHAVVMIRMKVMKDNQIEYRFDYPHIEDRDLWFRLLFKTEFYNIQKPLLKYRLYGNNITLLNIDTKLSRTVNFYLHIYSNLGVDVSSNELRIFYDHGKTIKPTVGNLKIIHHFLNKLKLYNKYQKKFDENCLNNQISIYWNKLIYRSMNAGFTTGAFYLVRSRIFNPLKWLLLFKKTLYK